MRYLAGQTSSIGGALAVGVGGDAPATSNLRLTHELDRATIYLVSPDYIDKKIIFKANLDEGTVGSIYEVGLFSSPLGTVTGSAVSKALASFERTVESWSDGTFASGNHRIGFEALRLAPAANGTATSTLPISLDLSSYTNEDIISLAYYNLDSNATSITVRFKGTDPAAYYEFVSPAQVGYSVANVKKSLFAKTGAVDWSLINSIEISVASGAGAAQVDLDGLRIESGGYSEDNVLVSRSVLPQPIVKLDGYQMEVEYALEVAL